MKVEQPHGYLKDGDGRIFIRFGDWSTEYNHNVPDVVDPEKTEFVDGPNAHEKEVHENYQTE